MSSQKNGKQSMGDLFMQQRRNRAASSAPSTNKMTPLSLGTANAHDTAATPTKETRQVKSFADIQREQQNEKQQKQQQQRNESNKDRSKANTPKILQRTIQTNNSRINPSPRRASQDNIPTEQGVIHTLLDKFGFIHCADRPAELFFHYTSTVNLHWEDLNIGDEVEFRVGNSSRRGHGEEDKLCALDVKVLPKNTIVWELEDVPEKKWRGVVDRVPGDRGREKVNGILRLEEGEESGEVTFASSDYVPKSSSARLGRGDIVEFSMFTERRTGVKLARNIQLVRSERDRIREEREAKLLENATLERGVVVSDKGDFGFLRSVNRVEEVYYHVANVLVEGDEEEGKGSVLKEGQEVEFYVVDESLSSSGGGGGGGKKKSSKSLSARKIKLLPQGTVKFEHVLAVGVTGVVVECPVEQGIEPFGSGSGKNDGRRGHPAMGKIRLEEPIIMEASGGQVVSEITLHPDLYPGGTFAMNRTGSEMGVWLRPGDVLLFDVVQQISDGSCKAAPTKYTQTEFLRQEGWKPDDSTMPAVRLVELALMGRTEGIVRSIRDDYAFIHCAERNVDAYMKLYELFPNEMHIDLMRNSPDLYSEKINLIQKGGRIQLEVGMEVSFDLSLQMLLDNSSSMAGRGGGRSKQNIRVPAEKESLRARRALILPKGTIKKTISIATGVKAIVTKDDPKQQFVGMLELEESITFPTSRQRFPYIAKLLDYVSAGKYGDEVIFHDVLSEKDSQAVISMVNTRDELEWRYVPLVGKSVEDSHHRKLCIAKRKKENAADGETPAVGNSVGKESELHEGKEGSDSPQLEAIDVITRETQGNDVLSDAEKKKKCAREKMIKNVRYDKFSFPDLSMCPLGVGDVITCDILLSRNSGHIFVENISLIVKKERATEDSTESEHQANGKEIFRKKNLTGYVTEVVPSRQFGFITGVDENGSKTGDHIFFHFKVVKHGSDTPQDAIACSAKAKKSVKTDAIRKGDEVKFDAEPGKNGKLTATTISILPRGTLRLPSKVDTSTFCTGYILLEPSHTSLTNTPSHIVLHSGPSLDGAGRWDNVGKEEKTTHQSGSNIKEEGVILLLTDPLHLFSPKSQSHRKSSIDDSCNETSQENGSSDEKPMSDFNDAAIFESAVYTHVRYKLSSLAHRGSSDYNENRPDGPRRGDLVFFGKTKGAKWAKDIRIEKLDAAPTLKGVLVDIKVDENTAVFVSSDTDTKYNISLSEVVSCEKHLLREKQEVNGVLHDGKIFGVCRMKDIFLTSSLAKNSSGSNNGPKQRPKLNLTVKKELQGMGGQIMAQSKMAKGPDGTIGFVHGWTKRLSPNAKTFIPSTIQVSGFNSNHSEEDASAD